MLSKAVCCALHMLPSCKYSLTAGKSSIVLILLKQHASVKHVCITYQSLHWYVLSQWHCVINKNTFRIFFASLWSWFPSCQSVSRPAIQAIHDVAVSYRHQRECSHKPLQKCRMLRPSYHHLACHLPSLHSKMLQCPGSLGEERLC